MPQTTSGTGTVSPFQVLGEVAKLVAEAERVGW